MLRTLDDIRQVADFQGNLKKRTRQQVDALRRSIARHGFAVPIFVWKDENGKEWMLDGHGRREAHAGKAPAYYIEAQSRQEAAELLMQINQKYGEITPEGLAEFTQIHLKDSDIDLENLPVVNLAPFELKLSDPQDIKLKDDYLLKIKFKHYDDCTAFEKDIKERKE